MTTPEGKVQSFCMAEFTKRGALVRKIAYEGRRGCPDLLVVFRGLVFFIEVKKDESTKPEEHQLREHLRLHEHGASVFVIGSTAQVTELVADICELT